MISDSLPSNRFDCAENFFLNYLSLWLTWNSQRLGAYTEETEYRSKYISRI